MINKDLQYQVSEQTLQDEYEFFKKSRGKLGGLSSKNNIVKFFQQDNFYNIEKQMWQDPAIREKLIANRCKYLNKTEEELTDNDILTGFKKSGMYYGYSHFNPLWFKWFIEKYGIKTCYDPCGGWGHRLLGSLSLDKYVYNDLSYHTACACQDIANYFGMDHVEWYCEDAMDCTGGFDCEAMFTCPPYYNVEHYECGDFDTYEDYVSLIDSIMMQFEVKSNYKYLGLVLREDLLPEHHRNYTEKYQLNVNKSQHLLKETDKKNAEYLYIWVK